MELRDRNGPGFAPFIDCLHPGVERSHRNGHIGWMRGYALVAGAEYGMNSVETA